MPEAFELKEQGRVLEVTLCRGKANTITAEDSRELNRMWESFRDNEAQRFAILTGKGEKFFCAGWDLKNVAERKISCSLMVLYNLVLVSYLQ